MVSPTPAGSQGTSLCTEGKRPPLTFSPVRISFRNGAKTSSEQKKKKNPEEFVTSRAELKDILRKLEAEAKSIRNVV